MANSFEGKKILIVDDDPDIVTAIKASLADMGAELDYGLRREHGGFAGGIKRAGSGYSGHHVAAKERISGTRKNSSRQEPGRETARNNDHGQSGSSASPIRRSAGRRRVFEQALPDGAVGRGDGKIAGGLDPHPTLIASMGPQRCRVLKPALGCGGGRFEVIASFGVWRSLVAGVDGCASGREYAGIPSRQIVERQK